MSGVIAVPRLPHRHRHGHTLPTRGVAPGAAGRCCCRRWIVARFRYVSVALDSGPTNVVEWVPLRPWHRATRRELRRQRLL